MKQITSPDNALVKKALKLKNPRNRDKNERCLVEGIRALEPFLKSPYQLARLYITKKHVDWALNNPLIDEKKIVLITDQIMQKISSATTPSGIIGKFDIPKSPNFDQLDEGIVLANIQDPGNMGTLIRTATALNRSVVLIDGVNPYNQKVIQATAGALAHCQLFKSSWDSLLKHKGDLKLGALVVTGGSSIKSITPNQKMLLVVGNEAHGIPEEWIKQCDELITLNMPGNTESLNAAIAGSIALYMMQYLD